MPFTWLPERAAVGWCRSGKHSASALVGTACAALFSDPGVGAHSWPEGSDGHDLGRLSRFTREDGVQMHRPRQRRPRSHAIPIPINRQTLPPEGGHPQESISLQLPLHPYTRSWSFLRWVGYTTATSVERPDPAGTTRPMRDTSRHPSAVGPARRTVREHTSTTGRRGMIPPNEAHFEWLPLLPSGQVLARDKQRPC
jgi:hypothetical protein